MSPDLMGPLMFGALIVFLLFGYPVAFSLAANGLLFAFIGIEMGLLTPDLLRALPQRIWGIMQNETLLAIPFFTFMGLILERSGMAEDLLDTVGQLFGPIKVKKGIASKVSFCIMPQMRCGKARSRSGVSKPISMPINANSRPLAASEKATG